MSKRGSKNALKFAGKSWGFKIRLKKNKKNSLKNNSNKKSKSKNQTLIDFLSNETIEILKNKFNK